MRLQFAHPFLSLVKFPDVTLPPLTVIVGLNGSGKSHLLQALANGAISSFMQSGDAPSLIHPSAIRLLAHGMSTFDMGDGYNSSKPGANQQTPTDNASAYQRQRDAALRPCQDRIAELFGIQPAAVLKGRILWEVEPEELAEILGNKDFLEKLEAIFQDAESILTHRRMPPLQNQDHLQMQEYSVFPIAKQTARRLGIPMIKLRSDHMRTFDQWGKVDQFSTNMPWIFGRYRDAKLHNRLLQLDDADRGTNLSLNNDQFVERFGSPPWDLLNETLKYFNLPYKVTTPPQNEFGNVVVDFIKIKDGNIVKFQNLSSGEKILTQFAVSSFRYDEDLVSVDRPKILLLDEMDASLHPEMVQTWLNAIKMGFVAQQAMHCILTTHSPTTVALADEGTLFEMQDGHSGLIKISKQGALNKLTLGVPTLSINYSGRRQVFSESDTDAEIYEAVYERIKTRIHCDRELNFLSTGLRDKNNVEKNSGSSIVKRTVESLSELGNSSIFGIVDWDGENFSTDRIKVIAQEECNAIENVLLNPLLVALLLIKEQRFPEGFEELPNYLEVKNLKAFDLQRLVDYIQSTLFPSSTTRREIEYIGGANCLVLVDYLECDDHELEYLLFEKFDGLRRWRQGRGALVKAVVKKVLSEHSWFCPKSIAILFENIANSPT
ncbi:AAA family ATPase [Novosphingobium sp.]|uniref:AAA family ATPase n=1 Tax=Novosphingobium sp. TaxID=1874826 RepID=UPI003D0CAB4C